MINVVTWLDSNKYRNEISAVCAGNGIRIVADEFEGAQDFLRTFDSIDANIDVLVIANSNLENVDTYNPSKLELVDLCSLTYKKELTAGAINGTNITIVSVDTLKGEIVFKNPNAENGNVSKVLNTFKFKGLVSGEQTTITIE